MKKYVTKNGEVKTGRTGANCYLQVHQFDSTKFPCSSRGKGYIIAESLFAEDEALMLQFKSWACVDIGHLSIQKAQEFVNDKLMSSWVVLQLKQNMISYPVSARVVLQWMKEAGFCYKKHQKSYYVDQHEDTDVVADQKLYIAEFFDDEIYEHCWNEIPR